MWVYDVETLRFLAVNDAAVRHYGYARDEFLAMSITEMRPAEQVEGLLANLEHEGHGSPIPHTWQHRTKDGTVIDVEITAGRVVFEGRDAALILAHDVSERRRMEQRLIEAEKLEAVGRLAGGVAHDFNNLLTVIHGYASLLAETTEGETHDGLGEILHAAEQASALTRQLLAFSRRQVMRADVLDLNEIVAGMQPMLQRIIGDDVSIGVRLAQGLAAVEADRAQIERVILNLAAKRATRCRRRADHDRDRERRARRRLRRQPRRGRAGAARDARGLRHRRRHERGRPAPPVRALLHDQARRRRHRPRARDRVRRREAERRQHLPLQRGGRGDDVQDLPPRDRGRAPRRRPPAARRRRSCGGPRRSSSSRTIPACATSCGSCSRRAATGSSPRPAPRRPRQVCEAGGAGIDLVLTDLMMPGMNGRALAERLAELCPATRILFMSGYSDEAVHHHGVIRQESAYVEKPFTALALTRRVRELLDRPL